MRSSLLWTRSIDKLQTISLSTALVLIGFGAFFLNDFIRENYEEKLLDELQTVLDSANQGITLWAEDHMLQAEAIAGNQELLGLTEQLLKLPTASNALLNTPAQNGVRDFFNRRLENSLYQGFFIIGPGDINLASSRDANVGVTNLLSQEPDVLKTLWSGRHGISQIQHTDVPLGREHFDATMFAGAPIKNQQGQVIALLTLRLDPHRSLYPLLMQARFGQSGETYIFGSNGLMLSPSHFLDHLYQLNLLESGEHSELNIRILDPERNLLLEPQRPGKPEVGSKLTLMAQSALRKESDSNLQGYRDYRGVPVVGAWLWNDTLNIGITTEQDHDEAFRLLQQIQWLIFGAATTVVLIILLMSYVFVRSRMRIVEAENRLHAIINTANDGIVVIDERGIIESVNPATSAIFGYQPNQLLGKNINMLMPEPYRSEHDSYLNRYKKTGEENIIGSTRELTALHADGSPFDIELSVNRLDLYSGQHFSGIIRDVTERKQAQLLLEDERNFSRQVLDSLNSQIVVLNAEGEIIFTNESWGKLALESGFGEAPGIGWNYVQVAENAKGPGMEQGHQVAAELRELLSGKKDFFSCEYDCHTPSRQRWYQLRATAFRYQQEVAVVITHVNITERVLSELSIKQERDKVANINRLLSVTENALDRTDIAEYWVSAENGRVMRVNNAACERLGYSREQLLKMTVPDFAPDFPAEQWKTLVAPIRETGWGRFEAIHKTSDGRLIPVEITAMFQSQGFGFEEDMFITFVNDISQRVKADNALKELNERLRMMALVAEKTDNAVVVTGLDKRIKWVNAGFSVITGYSFDEAIGQNPGALLQGPETDLETVRSISEALDGYQRIETEIINYSKDGIPYWIEIEIAPVSNEQGEVIEFIALERDITEQKRAASELLRAKEDAEAANRAKSTFLASMSHEIRTPLNGIVSTIDMLDQGKLDNYQQDMVDTAKDSSLTLMRIIDDILDFSKIEAGRMDLEQQPVELENLLESVSESLRANALQRNVELLAFCDPRLPTVEGDAVRLKQVLYNLSGNAIKFSSNLDSRKGQVKVSIHLIKTGPDSIKLQLKVEDNGIGMSDEVQQRVFTPFVQGEGDTTRRFGGTGLGLVITRRLVELMHGDISVDSKPDEGTCFSITLELPTAVEQAVKNNYADLNGVHILAVMNNEFIAECVQDYLRFSGATVTRSSHQQALDGFDAILTQPCSEIIVVIDCFEQDELCEQIRQSMLDRQPAKRLRFVQLSRGRRKNTRLLGDNTLLLDVDAVARRTLINTVAVAAGRESLRVTHDVDSSMSIPAPTLSAEEARAAGQVILLADDNKTNQKVIGQQINMLGYAVDVAEDGLQALSLWQANDYLMLLTDCHMPNMDGYDLARSIRATETGSQHFPIIAITADAMKGASELCVAAGMDGYLTKPMQLHELQGAINEWLAEADVPVQPVDNVALSSDVDEVVDATMLATLLGSDDPAMLKGFYQDFINTSEETHQAMTQAFKDGKAHKVGEEAHKLKSSANTVGAHAMGEHCLQLEKAGKAGDREAVARLMPELADAYNRVKAWIEDYKQNH